MNRLFVRAVLCWAALFFTSVCCVAAQSARESHKDLIEKAQNLILQKDRLKAAQVLQQGIQSINFSAQERSELKKNLHKLATLFISNRSQQNYQLAESLYFSEQTGALTKAEALGKYKEAQKNEPHNVLILRALSRAFLQQEQCTQALQTLQLGYDINPYDPVLIYYHIRALYCLARESQGQRLLEQNKKTLQKFKLYTLLLNARWSLKKNSKSKALRLAQAALKVDENFPEVYYWLWRIRPVNNGLVTRDGQKYLELCKNNSAKIRRKYKFEPRMCGFITEVDDFIKNHVSN